jgi:hypothetical protein
MNMLDGSFQFFHHARLALARCLGHQAPMIVLGILARRTKSLSCSPLQHEHLVTARSERLFKHNEFQTCDRSERQEVGVGPHLGRSTGRP